MQASVIIPTFNRQTYLRGTLRTLEAQAFSRESFEVIVVDDGSTDSTKEVCKKARPFELRYLHQKNQGDAAARNAGVAESRGEILVFLDDDILLHPEYLVELMIHHQANRERVVIGTAIPWLEESEPPWFQPLGKDSGIPAEDAVPVPFTAVCSNNMSLPRNTYLALGKMSALNFRGSSVWCDVEFAYRAHQRGTEFLKSFRAVCWHRDHVAKTFEAQKKRMREAGFRAGPLFHKHPKLVEYLPMFEDKVPINWRVDPLSLIARKLARQVASADLMMRILERTDQLARTANARGVSRALSRWILGGHLFSGYRDGIRSLQGE